MEHDGAQDDQGDDSEDAPEYKGQWGHMGAYNGGLGGV